ncbi:hypothetical protein [Sphingobium subterraneum]|uniref:Uncharacterized protein n=1 Tax=Sphingobium subterraneum TaxID=627688 RepID=A0A841J4Y4_9SPHN|nr:hypothetical protein [Sphingobium subterraneum]MBB6125402.1 hypothetical protein [Sphingobium subterraneum]
MVILVNIRRLVERLKPAPICDACVAERLEIGVSDTLRAGIGELAGERDYQRERSRCSLCDTEGMAIRKIR